MIFMKRRRESTLVVILEWICGIAAVLALVSTTWASFVYKDRNGSFLPMIEPPKKASSTMETAESLPVGRTTIPNANNLEMDPNASAATPVPQQMQGETVRNVSIAGFKTLKIAANTTEVTVDFYNPEANEGEFLMTFELLLPTADGYEMVYSSGLVDAGQHIRNISLSHPVAVGTYEDCILHVQPYFARSGEPTNAAEIRFTLTTE